MNPFKRFSEFISYPSHGRTLGLLAFLVVLLAVPLTVNIAQKQQELRQHASNCTIQQTCPNCGTNDGQGNCYVNVAEKTGFCGPVLEKEVCVEPSPTSSTQTVPFPGATRVGQSADGSVIIWFDPTTGKNRFFNGNTEVTPQATTAPVSSTRDCGTPPFPGAVCSGLSSDGTTTIWFDPTTGANRFFKGNAEVTPQQPSSSPSTACDANKGFLSPCKYGTDTQKNNATACTNPQGIKGVSVMECQTNNCWYDSYYDQTPAKVQQGKNLGHGWCYASGQPAGIAISCTGADPICTNGGTPTKNANGNWWCSLPGDPNKDSGAAPTCKVNGTLISFTIGLDGIGSAGDSKFLSPSAPPGTVCKPGFSAASCGSNQNPVRKTRTLYYQVFTDSTKSKVLEEGQTTITYNNFGVFVGNVSLKNTLTNGTNYPIKARSDGFLARVDNVAIANNSGLVKLVGQGGNLVSGNLVGGTNRQVGPLDFNQFNPCYGKPAPASGICSLADLNDDGTVDIIDFNLFLREYGQQETD